MRRTVLRRVIDREVGFGHGTWLQFLCVELRVGLHRLKLGAAVDLLGSLVSRIYQEGQNPEALTNALGKENVQRPYLERSNIPFLSKT